MGRNYIEEETPPPSYQSAMNLLQRVTITQQPGKDHSISTLCIGYTKFYG